MGDSGSNYYGSDLANSTAASERGGYSFGADDDLDLPF